MHYRMDLGMWERREGRRWHYRVFRYGRTFDIRHKNRLKRATAKVMRGPDPKLIMTPDQLRVIYEQSGLFND